MAGASRIVWKKPKLGLGSEREALLINRVLMMRLETNTISPLKIAPWLPLLTAGFALFFALGLMLAPNLRAILLMLLGVGAVSALTLLPHAALFPFYLCYLMFEGAAKVWTSYHPVVHVGSDLVLMFIVVRLWNRAVMGKFPQPKWSTANYITGFLGMFWLWVGVQFANPWGLGFVPSLAGLKVYVIPMLSFFTVAYLLKREEIRVIPKLVFCLGLAQCFFALTDYTLGADFMAALHPNYGQINAQFLHGYPYRPFGTTHLPGAPSLWVFHSSFAALLVFYLIRTKRIELPQLWQKLLVIYIPLSILTLVACQVRIAVIRFLLLGTIGLLLSGRKSFRLTVTGIATIIVFFSVYSPQPYKEDIRSYNAVNKKFSQAFSRIQTLQSARSWKSARTDLLALRRLQERAQSTLMGTGLSRTSAASSPWQARIAKDRHFGPEWSFTDNVLLTLFTELGAGGLLSYLALVAVILIVLLNTGTFPGRLAAAYCLVIFGSGVASEGILYQPDASAFWGAVGLGLRFEDAIGGST